jgi:hypothetical protein
MPARCSVFPSGLKYGKPAAANASLKIVRIGPALFHCLIVMATNGISERQVR